VLATPIYISRAVATGRLYKKNSNDLLQELYIPATDGEESGKVKLGTVVGSSLVYTQNITPALS
jgi:hypothetical protein